MRPSDHDYKSLRPLLGTFFEIKLNSEANPDFVALTASEAFNEAENLEKIFSPFQKDSDVNQFNRGQNPDSLSDEFRELMTIAKKLSFSSQKAFNPYWINPKTLDLTGIAKGFIVDKVYEYLIARLPDAEGSVSAGGDIRLIDDSEDYEFTIRAGRLEQPIVRTLRSEFPSIATSSVQFSRKKDSTTRYPHQLRQGLTEQHTIVALSALSTIADGLTKVALFAEPEVLTHTVHEWNSRVLIIAPDGQLTETYPLDEI
jgi:thiamine biosynthesis lipoprotein ApbE